MKALLAILTSVGIGVQSVTTGCGQGAAPEWRVVLNVIDDAGQPVSGAVAKVWYHLPPPHDQSIAMTNKTGLTDSNGVFIASGRSRTVELIYEAQKDGYYSAGKSYELGHAFEYTPEKWNPTLTLVLHKIGRPAPMYARKARIELPEAEKPVGFDLIESDWVAPYGKGKQSDFVFEVHRRWVSRRDFDSALTLTFANPGDGFLPAVAPPNRASALRISPAAPAQGYEPRLTRRLSHTPAGGWQTDESKERNYYFRVRTVLDEKGGSKSALYGKIHGDIVIDPINSKTMIVQFTYYLNPTPNDRNVEFDPKRNLLQGLKAAERVDAP